MTRSPAATIIAIVLASTACSSDDAGDAAPPITGGEPQDGDRAVGMLRSFTPDGSVAACTATLIAPDLMVTAAHCAGRAQFDVSFDTEPDLSQALAGDGYIAATVVPNPAFTGDPRDGHDVAVVQLSRPVPTEPVAIGGTPRVGSTLRAVGYGMDVFGQDGTGVGTRRQVAVSVNEVSEHEIVTGSEGASTCHGDSGGPFFDPAGGMVAITSYGDDAGCHGSSHDMRLDDNLDFIESFLGGDPGDDGDGNDDGGSDDGGSDDGGGDDGGGSNTCHVNQNGFEIECTDGDCVCSIDGEEVGTCTADDPTTACSSPGNCCGF